MLNYIKAPDILTAAADHMNERAQTYDSPEGERSMAKTVAAFNAITGCDLGESDGWLFMCILKMVRSEQCKALHVDSIEDLVAYSSLYGESKFKESNEIHS
jgi:hypothetical protein